MARKTVTKTVDENLEPEISTQKPPLSLENAFTAFKDFLAEVEGYANDGDKAAKSFLSHALVRTVKSDFETLMRLAYTEPWHVDLPAPASPEVVAEEVEEY